MAARGQKSISNKVTARGFFSTLHFLGFRVETLMN